MRFIVRLMLVLAGCCVLNGCSSLSYYSHVIGGHFSIMGKRQPIDKLLAADDVDADLKAQLAFIQEIRDYASSALLLPENKSYRYYADIGRPYVNWTVMAAPEFSLEPVRWCFFVTGCVSYRGFFKEAKAQAFVEPLRASAHDVYVYGVTAYSTLGWFDDPVLNTMLRRDRLRVAGLIIHELAHQKVFIKNSVEFNEAFATAVQEIGMVNWLSQYGTERELASYQLAATRRQAFVDIVKQTRAELEVLYALDISKVEKQQRKAAVLAQLQQRHMIMQQRFDGQSGYEWWFEKPVNNAQLNSIASYYDLVPFFKQLYEKTERDFEVFYKEVKRIGKLPAAEREILMGLKPKELITQGTEHTGRDA